MQHEAGVCGQLALDRWGLVGRGVVQHDVRGQVCGNLLVGSRLLIQLRMSVFEFAHGSVRAAQQLLDGEFAEPARSPRFSQDERSAVLVQTEGLGSSRTPLATVSRLIPSRSATCGFQTLARGQHGAERNANACALFGRRTHACNCPRSASDSRHLNSRSMTDARSREAVAKRSAATGEHAALCQLVNHATVTAERVSRPHAM